MNRLAALFSPTQFGRVRGVLHAATAIVTLAGSKDWWPELARLGWYGQTSKALLFASAGVALLRVSPIGNNAAAPELELDPDSQGH